MVGSIIFSIIIGEIVLQISYKYNSKLWLWESEAFKVPFVEKVGTRREYRLRPNFQNEKLGIKIDPQGFRSLGLIKNGLTKNSPAIIFLGDSVPYGFNVKDNESYPAQFANLTNKKGKKYNVINAGVPSYTIWQSIDRFREDVLPTIQPSLLILQAANDISLLTYFREDWNETRTWAGIGLLEKLGSLQNFEKSAIIFFCKKFVLSHQAKSKKIFSLKGRSHLPYNSDAMLKHLDHELNWIAMFAYENNTPLVLLPIDPFYYQTYRKEKNKDLILWEKEKRYVEAWDVIIEQVNHLLQKKANKNKNCYFFDTRPYFDKTNRDLMYIDFIHYSKDGNQYMAELLYNFFEKNKLLP